MKLQIMLDVGPPAEQYKGPAPEQKPPVEDRIRQAIECIESGHDSYTEWKLINKIYKELRKRKPSARVKSLIEMIEPVLSKYGLHGVDEESA